MEGCPVYTSIMTLRPEQDNTNFHSNQQQTSFIQPQPHFTTQGSDPIFFKAITTTFLPPEHASLQHQRPQTGRHQRCHAHPSPQHPETSSSSSDLEATFTVRHTGDRLQITQEHPHTRKGRERNNIKTATANTFVISDSKHKHFVGLLNICWCSRTQTQQTSSIRSKPELRK